MTKNDIKKFKDYLLNGRFSDAKLLINGLDNKAIYDLIVEVNFNDESIVGYSFLTYLLEEDKSAEMHINAASFLAFFLFYVKGAYSSALYHLRRAIEIDPENIQYQEFLLHFNEIPDQLVSKDEAIAVARSILKKKSNSSPALRILADYNV